MLSETSDVSLLTQDVPLDAFSLTGKQVALNNDFATEMLKEMVHFLQRCFPVEV